MPAVAASVPMRESPARGRAVPGGAAEKLDEVRVIVRFLSEEVYSPVVHRQPVPPRRFRECHDRVRAPEPADPHLFEAALVAGAGLAQHLGRAGGSSRDHEERGGAGVRRLDGVEEATGFLGNDGVYLVEEDHEGFLSADRTQAATRGVHVLRWRGPIGGGSRPGDLDCREPIPQQAAALLEVADQPPADSSVRPRGGSQPANRAFARDARSR